MLNERTGDPKLPKLALRDVFEKLGTVRCVQRKREKAKRQIFGSGGDGQKKKKEKKKTPKKKRMKEKKIYYQHRLVSIPRTRRKASGSSERVGRSGNDLFRHGMRFEPSKYLESGIRDSERERERERERSIEIVDFTRLWRRVFRRHATVFRSRGMSKRAEDIENDLD